MGVKYFLLASTKMTASAPGGAGLTTSGSENKLQKRRRIEELNKRYQTRVTVARLGQENMVRKNYANALKYYNQYLKVIADIHGVDVYEMGPTLFGPKEVSEKLLISHVFWDICRICDLSSHLKGELQKNLTMFIAFTVNQPYQALNSEMIRRQILKGKMNNIKIFADSFKKIQISSKKCFIATYALGPEHWATVELRIFKNQLLEFHWGPNLVHFYYRHSSRAVEFLENKKISPLWARFIFTVPLTMLALFNRITRNKF